MEREIITLRWAVLKFLNPKDTRKTQKLLYNILTLALNELK